MVATSGRLKNHHPAPPTPPPFLEKPRDPEGGAIYKALISYDCQQLYEAPEWTGEATPVQSCHVLGSSWWQCGWVDTRTQVS